MNYSSRGDFPEGPARPKSRFSVLVDFVFACGFLTGGLNSLVLRSPPIKDIVHALIKVFPTQAVFLRRLNCQRDRKNPPGEVSGALPSKGEKAPKILV